MKMTSIVLSVVLMSGNAFSSNAAPKISPVPVIGVYSPLGFDSNDDVEVMVEGYLPNLCYKSPVIKSVVTGNKIAISVSAYHASQKGITCLEMIVPFVERVSLGVLNDGDYKVLVNGKMNSNIKIVKSDGPLIDKFIYANVDAIAKIDGVRKVVLKGFNPSDCLEVDKIKIISNGLNVYSILPQMKKVREFCPQKMVAFSYEVEIPNDLEADKILLHARAMDGQSVNLLYNNFAGF